MKRIVKGEKFLVFNGFTWLMWISNKKGLEVITIKSMTEEERIEFFEVSGENFQDYLDYGKKLNAN